MAARNEALAAALAAAAGSLRALDPREVMGRGYSIARRKSDGRVVRGIGDVSEGVDTEILVRDGTIDARVLAVREQAVG